MMCAAVVVSCCSSGRLTAALQGKFKTAAELIKKVKEALDKTDASKKVRSSLLAAGIYRDMVRRQRSRRPAS